MYLRLLLNSHNNSSNDESLPYPMHMGKHSFEPIDVRFEVFLGLILVTNTLSFGIGFDGPWGDPGFTRGVLGLLGTFFLYRAWFARTFGFHGIIPSLHLWSKPQQSISRISLFGIGILMLSWLIGNTTLKSFFAEPTSLILTLVGMLMLLMSTYAWLVIDGGLGDTEEE